MGGYAALAFAARHRERLSALVLADTRAAADSAEARAGRAAALATLARRRPGRLPRRQPCRACCRRTRRPRWSRTCARAPRRAPPACAPASRRCATAPTAPPSWAPSPARRWSCAATDDQVTPAGGDEADRRRDRGRALRPDRRTPATCRTSRRPGAFLHAVTSFLDTRGGDAAVMKLDATFFDRVQGAAHAAAEQLGVDGADVGGRARARAWAASPIGWRARAACRTRRCPAFPRRPSPATPAAWSPARSRARPRCCCAGACTATRATRPARSASACASSAALGVRTLIVTNASGGVDPTLAAGRHRRDLRPHQPDRRRRRCPGPTTNGWDRASST